MWTRDKSFTTKADDWRREKKGKRASSAAPSIEKHQQGVQVDVRAGASMTQPVASETHASADDWGFRLLTPSLYFGSCCWPSADECAPSGIFTARSRSLSLSLRSLLGVVDISPVHLPYKKMEKQKFQFWNKKKKTKKKYEKTSLRGRA